MYFEANRRYIKDYQLFNDTIKYIMAERFYIRAMHFHKLIFITVGFQVICPFKCNLQY